MNDSRAEKKILGLDDGGSMSQALNNYVKGGWVLEGLDPGRATQEKDLFALTTGSVFTFDSLLSSF